MRTVDIDFNSKRGHKRKLAQAGTNGYSLLGTKPSLRKLVEFEQLSIYDTSVSFALFVLIDTVLSSLDDISHPDPDIQSFCRENISRLGGIDSESNTPLYAALYKMIMVSMWSGFSVTESIFEVDQGSIWIKDFITYHPASITIRPDRKGRLIEGKKTLDSMTSGIYQSGHEGEVLIPLWKCIRLTRSEMYGNFYGTSLLETVYKWTILKEALLDMMAVALDRFGNPIVALTFPLYNTGQTSIDPNTGEEIELTTQELLEKQILNNQFSGGGNVLLLPQVDKDMKPTAQVLTTGNNVGDTFLNAIYNCDREISKGLFVPYGLSSNDSSISGESTQQQMLLFDRIRKATYAQTIPAIVNQSFHRLIKLNFNRESAKIAPTMALKQSSRPEDRVSLMQVISNLTDRGYFNPQNESDWSMVRQMVEATDREFKPEDLKFIKDMIITPRQPGPSGSGSSNASKEGVKKPKGSGAGRPIGSSAPKNNKN